MASSTLKKKVIIIGAGAFGLSTALHLQRHHRDDIDVLLLDSAPFPSIDSASGNDTSRAIRMDYADPFYSKLAKEAIEAWQTDPVFLQHFHLSGRIGAQPPGHTNVEKCKHVLRAGGVAVEDFGEVDKVSALQRKFPLLGNKDKLRGWDLYYVKHAGWANPKEAVISAMTEFESLGGEQISDPQCGRVVANIISGSQIQGVKTADGHSHLADHVIYATGAFSTSNKKLLPGLGTQIHPTGFAIAHWKLEDPEELKAWEGYPAVDIYHNGYFFPPDPATGLMKLGLGIVGFTHDENPSSSWEDQFNVGIALRNSDLVGTNEAGKIPSIAEEGIRWVLDRWAPSLAAKTFFDMKICWDAMTPDGGWLIDHHPDIQGLSIATGGSGHGFKFLPVLGSFIIQALGIAESNRTAGPQLEEMRSKWRWGRPSNMDVKDRKVVLQGRPILNVMHHLRAQTPGQINDMVRCRL
ncbi:FAD dependent oxidoreductase [Colletotrichum chrysophilum]|uniref:FAD dependent oxidoreductase n=1 Tax=Colletotrichum chrysophilum TaxID=1836956 RepID=A0AAD9EEZ8_9PEZI|nr:FAD dependent oxidoreductase [Colletotrichum chrysophilum]